MPDQIPLDPAARVVAPTKRSDEFRSVYANNVRFEPTVYDFKLIFGQSDLSSGTEVTEQHTAVTIPWSLIKLVIYFLQVHLIFQEIHTGKITLPESQVPPRIPDPSAEQANDPVFMSVLEKARKLRDDFIASL
jgi:hypothetical protein